MKPLVPMAAVILLAVVAGAPVARADEHGRGRPHEFREFREFRDHDIRHFERHDFDTWRGGRWEHGWHDGHIGWWWGAGGSWYEYPYPVYPYPAPYTPPTVIVQQPAPPLGPAPEQFWYYCDNPKGYYPYVATCPTPWRPVPAQPSQ